MPINILNLNEAPYYDDFDLTKQYYRILFKPRFAVQARELTQLQTILQNQIEQFGDNIYQEGSIIKGCNFTEFRDLEYVKVRNPAGFDVQDYVGSIEGDTEIAYELEGQITGLRASIIAAARGFETNDPDLNTFFIKYLNKNDAQDAVFLAGETLNINRIRIVNDIVSTPVSGDTPVTTINVTNRSNPVGKSFGLSLSEGIVFQKGHFLYAEEQLVIASKYTNIPDGVSIGYRVEERIVRALQDSSLYDNALGAPNENAPGADRLKLIPTLVAIPTSEAEVDPTFFILARYVAGTAVQVRDVSQFNVIGQELARRTYEESGDYALQNFDINVVRRSVGDNDLQVSVGPGIAYIKGFRVENRGEIYIAVDPIESTNVQVNQPVSFDYGGYVDITSIDGTIPFGSFATVNLQNSSLSNIGTAIVKNITSNRLYLFDVRMSGLNKFSDVVRIVGTSGNITISSNSPIRERNRSTLVFDTGVYGVYNTENIDLPVRARKSLTGLSGNTVVINAETGEDFANATNDDIVFVDSNNTLIGINDVSLSVNSTVMTLTLDQEPSSNATIYYNKRILNAEPYSKISKDVFVKIDYSTSATKYNLGFPDVYEIISIVDSSNNTVTSSFNLRTNQKDHYYDHSYIELIPGFRQPTEGELVVQMKVFQLNNTSGQYFFTVESYPSDLSVDVIPPYVSSAGQSFDLVDSFDFRPYVELLPGASYTANTALLASVVSDANTGIDLAPDVTSAANNIIIPALNNAAQVDIEYYLNRTDLITLDSYGQFSIIKGDEKRNSVAPVSDDRMAIGEIYIPGNPALTPDEAAVRGKPQYSVITRERGTKNYTMKEIEQIDQRVEQLRYYVVLSQLEASTQNLNILDENGLSRFKNGIIVDSFDDLSVADIENIDFKSAHDFTEKSLTPAVKTFPLNLKLSSSANATMYPSTNFPEVATLAADASPVSIISQPFATNFRNCVSNFYNYKGIGSVSPEYDAAYDTVTNPASIISSSTTTITNRRTWWWGRRFGNRRLQRFFPLTSVSPLVIGSTLINSPTFNRVIFGRRFFRGTLQVTNTSRTRSVGDFVSNLEFKPYMRSRDIAIFMTGLRPNTRHYVFFDKEDVNEFVMSGTNAPHARDMQRNGVFGEPIISDSSGTVRVIFNIPEGRFFVGDRNIEVTDVDEYDNITSAGTSYGLLTYRAYNFSVEKTALTVATRSTTTFINATSSNRNVINRVTQATPLPSPVIVQPPPSPPPPPPPAAPPLGRLVALAIRQNQSDRDDYNDPIAQTFFIKTGMGLGSDTVFVSRIDLYFKRKSQINGVTVMLRAVTNGYPAPDILPFSSIHFTPDEINISDDGTVATIVNFDAPVRLETEREYCVVVMPDAADPDYLIYTSKVGGTNLVDGSPVTQDWGDGVLFTSTNNRAWKSEQDEDLKFTLYRSNFAANLGVVTLTNEDHEFLTNTNNIGRFNVGELVYTEKALQGSTSNTVSVAIGNTSITGTNLSDTFAVGDFAIINDGTNKNVIRVTSAASDVITADRPATFTGSATILPVVVATLVNYDFSNPEEMILENSSAAQRVGGNRIFASGNIVYGYDSGAQATISSVDNIDLSYIQPMLLRTNDSVTVTGLVGTFTDPVNTSQAYNVSMSFNDKTTFNTRGVKLFSKSNDLLKEKPFLLSVTMSNSSNPTSTPFVDIQTAMVFAYQYDIDSRYISIPIELAEDLDAEDFQLYVTAYRPRGTEIKTYIKVQNQNDPNSFDNNDWIELENVGGSSLFSSSSNLEDFREHTFRVSEADKDNGIITYTNSAGSFDGYRKFAIRIDLISENMFNVPRLLDYRGIALT